MLLDPINLVTCLYRLAKMSFSQRSRGAYLQELQRAPTFQLLLREPPRGAGRGAGGSVLPASVLVAWLCSGAAPPSASDPPPHPPAPPPPAGSISAQFLHAQLLFLHVHAEPKGVDGRCLANLLWALAKLDLSSDAEALSTEIALNAAPFVLRNLANSSPQARGARAARGVSAAAAAAAVNGAACKPARAGGAPPTPPACPPPIPPPPRASPTRSGATASCLWRPPRSCPRW